jgi:hypothetical protein
MLSLFYFQCKNSRYPSDGKLSGFQSHSGLCRYDKNLDHLQAIKPPIYILSALSLVTILTNVSRLPGYAVSLLLIFWNIYIEKSNKMQQFIKIYYSICICSSICFGRHTAHHYKPTAALAASGFAYVEG